MVMPKLGEVIEPVRIQHLAPKPWWREIAVLEGRVQRPVATPEAETELEQTAASLPQPID
jgi:hypothetical protein